MSDTEVIELLSRWVYELRVDLHSATERAAVAEDRCLALEQHIRSQALIRRRWVRAGYAEAVI